MPLFYIFSVCIALQAIFSIWMLWAAGQTGISNKVSLSKEELPLSIIICARNEAHNLKANLASILNQDYSNYEVIVVNDASEDETETVVANFKEIYPKLVVVTICPDEARTLPGKKFALSKGIAQAKNEHILLCDADCIPATKHWAKIMSAPFHCKKEIVTGYGAYKKTKGWLNTFIRWETLHTFVQYSTYTNSGLPYMAVGRNLAYKKSMLLEAQQHPLWTSMPSGDDDLLIRLMATKRNTVVVSSPEAFTYSNAKNTFKDWILQKQRHLSTGKLYSKPVQFLLSLYAGSHSLMWLSFLVLVAAGYAYLVLTLMLLRCLLSWSVWAIAAGALREKKILLYLPICDLGWAIYNLILSPYIFYKTKKQWT